MAIDSSPAGPLSEAHARAGRAFVIGIVGNVSLAIVKLVVGFAAGSSALIADGWHSLADILTNGGAWLAFRLARIPPDDDHHYGHGPLESLAAALIGGLLIAGGFGVMWNVFSFERTLEEGSRGVWALWTAAVSIVLNLFLAWISVRAGREAASQSLMALARDNASDALAGVLVFIGIFATRAGIVWADPLAGVLIGLLIVTMGLRSFKEGIEVLVGKVPDEDLRAAITAAALGVEGVRAVQRARIHPLGTSLRVDMEISVDGRLTVEEGHEIAHAAEIAVTAAHPPVEEVSVHVNPWTPPGVRAE